MNGAITMREKDLERVKVLQQLKEKKITQMQAAVRLDISTRQIRNLLKRYNKLGDEGVISQKVGKQSNNQLPQELKTKALQLIKEIYHDFGPTLASEKLSKIHNLDISVESVRKLMIANKLWIPSKEPPPNIHRLRMRRLFLGDLVQADGSHHCWFENRGEKCCLIVLIDDATSSLCGLYFTKTECLEAYFEALKILLLEQGRPLEMYTDRFSVFSVARKNPLLEDHPLTQFERALRELGIKLIHAKTPQAKGRVERVNRTLQDRLIKELRLRRISDIASANAWIKTGEYIREHNAKFAVLPSQAEKVFRPLTSVLLQSLDRILAPNSSRSVQKDLSFQYRSEIYQIYGENSIGNLRGKRITIWEKEGRVYAEFQGEKLEIHSMKESEYFSQRYTEKELLRTWKTRKPHKPDTHHPYKTIFKIKKVG